MFNVIVLFVVFSGGAILISILSRQRFEIALPVYLFSTIFVMYLSAFINALPIAVIICVLAAITGYGLLLYKAIYKKEATAMLHSIGTPGFVAFVLLFIFIYVINIGYNFLYWDEFSHWGIMIKETLRLNNFHNTPGSVLLVNQAYPPAIPLFQYFWCKLTGGYSEPSAARALQFLALSALLPVFKYCTHKTVVKNISLLFLLVFIPAIVSPITMNLYDSIYTDAALAVFIGATLALVVRTDHFNWFAGTSLFLYCFVMTATKEIGIIGLLAIAVYIGSYILVFILQGFTLKGLGAKLWQYRQSFAVLAVCVAGCLFSILTWRAHNKSIGIYTRDQFGNDNIILQLLWLFNGKVSEELLPIRTAFMNGFINRTISENLFQFSAFFYFFPLTIAAFLLYWKQRKSVHKGKYLAMAITVPAIYFAYSVALMYLFVYKTPLNVAVELSSFERYMATIITAVLCGLFVVIFSINSHVQPTSESGAVPEAAPCSLTTLALSLALFVSLFGISTVTITNFFPLYRGTPYFANQQLLASSLYQAIDVNNDRVFLIFQGSTGGESYALRYFAHPLRANAFPFSFGPPAYDGDMWGINYNAEEFAGILKEGQYDYVLIGSYNNFITQEFGVLFSEPKKITEHGLYKVIHTDNGIQLSYVQTLAGNPVEMAR